MPIRVERSGPVTTVVIDRPERRNAIDRVHAETLADAVRAFEADDDAHVLVLWGAGGCFSAGADLRAIARGTPNRVERDGDGPLGPTRIMTEKPTIAAIEGHAVAGGLELALWCDLRVAAVDATFGVLCRRFGVPLVDGGTVRLPRLIGQSRALDLILTGRTVDATEAERIGLVQRLAPSGRARAMAEALGRALAEHPVACLRADLASTRAAFDHPLDRALQLELDGGRAVLHEATRGAARFASGEGRAGAAVATGSSDEESHREPQVADDPDPAPDP